MSASEGKLIYLPVYNGDDPSARVQRKDGIPAPFIRSTEYQVTPSGKKTKIYSKKYDW